MERYTAQRGQVLPLVALLIVVLMGFVAMAVDVGYHRYERRIQQSAADSAALAGAAEVPFGNVTKAAQYDASQNGFTDNTSNGTCTVCVAVTNPYNSDSNSVQVVVSAQHPTFFERVIGTKNVTVTARAVAKITDDNGCLYLLATHLTNFNNATVSAHNCAIISNGDMQLNGSTIDAAGIDIYNFNSAHYQNGTYITAKPAQLPIPASDPCQRIAGCAYLASYQPPKNCSNATYNVGDTVYAGCYGNLKINGPSKGGTGTTLFSGSESQPYVVTGTLDLTSATITGSNVTIYIAPGGNIKANNATVNFTSPPSTDMASNTRGVSIYDANNNENWDKINIEVNGLIYVPYGHTNINQSFGQYTVAVFGYVNFNTSNLTFTLPSAPSGQALIKDAILSE